MSKLDRGATVKVCEVQILDADERAICRLLTPGIKNVERATLMKSLTVRMREDYDVYQKFLYQIEATKKQ